METLVELPFTCPHCWESIETFIAPSELPVEMIEDCRVCCHPVLLRVTLSPEGEPELTAEPAA